MERDEFINDVLEKVRINSLIERWKRFLEALPTSYPQNLIDETAQELEKAWANPPEDESAGLHKI